MRKRGRTGHMVDGDASQSSLYTGTYGLLVLRLALCFCAALFGLASTCAGDEQRGLEKIPVPSNARGAAVYYYKAINADIDWYSVYSLLKGDKWKSVKIEESAIRVQVAELDSALRLLQAGARVKRCVWALSAETLTLIDDTPTALTVRTYVLAHYGLLRSNTLFENGKDTEAVRLLCDLLVFLRRTGNVCWSTYFAASACELEIIEYLAEVLPNASKETLHLLADSLDELPPAARASEIVRKEAEACLAKLSKQGTTFVLAVVPSTGVVTDEKRLARIARALGILDQYLPVFTDQLIQHAEVMAKIAELPLEKGEKRYNCLRSQVRQKRQLAWADILGACGEDHLGRCLNDSPKDRSRCLLEVAAQKLADRERPVTIEGKPIAALYFPWLVLPNPVGLRRAQVRLAVTKEMLHTGVRVLLQGTEVIQQSKDPYSGAPFKYEPRSKGFVLRSSLRDEDGSPVTLVFGSRTKASTTGQ